MLKDQLLPIRHMRLTRAPVNPGSIVLLFLQARPRRLIDNLNRTAPPPPGRPLNPCAVGRNVYGHLPVLQGRTTLLVDGGPAFAAGLELPVRGGFGDDVFEEGQVVDAADRVGCGGTRMTMMRRRAGSNVFFWRAWAAVSKLTEVFVLDGPPRFPLGFDDVHGLVGEVADEHFLVWGINAFCWRIGIDEVDRTVAIVIAKAALAET